ncbi:HTH domain-containing protein [Halorubrum sp. Atlit-26R]|uniref:HTH domain-containing protein n=1 Tax=Halorubrum sp. Atlit-26R TaxID=2282128 RepID=UPI000EF1BFD1|nr:HTH domain-containing protein [Halorubrum sp. Atlit-26R]RLM62481.1 ArsR family transcriptional regulator [Halorubrum sp. Atlit-26R]
MAKVDPEDVVDAIHAHEDPVVTAPELADELPVTARTVSNRLRELAAAGDVERKDVGGRAVVYWLPGTRKPRRNAKDRERRLAADQADLEEAAGEGGRSEDIPTSGIEAEPESERSDPGSRVDVDEVIEDLDLPGSGERVEQRREAVRACVAYLREHGEAQRSAFVDEVYPDHPAGFGSSGGWWNAIGKQGLAEVADVVDVVDAPPEGSHVWYWRGF